MFKRNQIISVSLVLVLLTIFYTNAPASDVEFKKAANSFLKDIHKKGFYLVDPEEVNNLIESNQDIYILDVRTPYEVSMGRIPGAVSIRLNALMENLEELPENEEKPIYVYCRNAIRSAYATAILRVFGYSEVFNISGGFKAWEDEGYPVTK